MPSSLADLSDLLEDEANVLVIGDLNCRIGRNGNDLSEEEQLSDVFSRRRTSLDTVTNPRGRALLSFIGNEGMVILNGRSPGDPQGEYTFIRSADSKSVIDLAFCTPHLLKNIVDFKIPPAFCNSDHVPILTLMNARSNYVPPSAKRRIRWNPHLIDYYNNALRSHLQQAQQSSPTTYESLRSAISGAAHDLGMVRTIRSNSQPPWFNPDCRLMKAKLRAAYRRRKRRGYDRVSLIELADARREYQTITRTSETAHYQSIISNIATASCSMELWGALRRLNNNKNNSSSQLSCESVTRHFLSLFNKFPITETPTCMHVEDVPLLDSPISPQELDSVIALLEKNKSPGPDGLGNEFYYAMDAGNREHLLSLFNNTLTTSSCPASWGQITITLIHKKGPTTDPANYRGISLMNSITKLFTSILTARLARWAEINDIIPEMQSGFRKQRGCTDNIFILNSLIQQKISDPKGKLYTAFIDFKQAFDSVNHSILWRKLISIGVSPRLINTIRSFYSVATARVSLPQGDTNPIPIHNGVLQGDTLSPLLFSLFLYDIESFIRENYPRIEGVSLNRSQSLLGLLYADDFVLFGRSKVELNHSLSALSDYATRNELVINVAKSKVVVFRKGGTLAKNTRFYMGQDELEIVNKYQYLGVWFSCSGSFSGHAQDVSRRAERAGAVLRSLLIRIGHFSSEMANTLTAAKVTSTLLHASEVWALDHTDTLSLPTLRFLKKLFTLPLSTPNHVVAQEFGAPCMKAIINRRAMSWLRRVAEMPDHRLPRICLEAQIDAFLHRAQRGSWLKTVHQRLLDADIEFSLDSWRRAPFADITSRLFKHDTETEHIASFRRAIDSSHCPLYRCLSGRSHFLTNEPISTLRLVLQVRLTNDRCPRLLWGGNRVTFSPRSPCPLCNRGSLDSMAHFILDCPVLTGYRPQSVRQVAAQQGPEHARLASLLNRRSALVELAFFLTAAMQARELAS